MQDHDVSVVLARDNPEFSSLIHMHDVFDVVCGYTDFPAPLLWLMNDVCVWHSFFS